MKKSNKASPTTIDEYIAGFPARVQKNLRSVRATIRKAAAGANEKISYQIPTFTLNGNLVHFAAWKNHLGFYPTSSGIRKFHRELSSYETARGSVKFPLNEPMPLELISRIVKFRVHEVLAKRQKM